MDEIYLNGKFISRLSAQISIMDRGFLFGDGVYELIPVYNKKIFLLHKHLNRLKNSLDCIGMSDIDGIEDIIDQLISRNTSENFFIYLHVTRGEQLQRNHIYGKAIEPTVLVMCEEYPSYDKDQIKKGFHACMHEDFRWLKSNIKSISLLGNVMLKNHASSNGYYETLLIRNNKLTEGSASNVFTVKNNIIHTPKLSNELLPGVTRDLLIDLIKNNNMRINESDISQEDLLASDEVWCSSSTNAVVPITMVDKHQIGSGEVGNISLQIYDITKDFIKNY
jgi:D-alanine transaminase